MPTSSTNRLDHLAANLRHLRKAAGFTQQKLADMAGLPRATLASMEHGGANPGLDSVLAVATALDSSLDDLVLAQPGQRYFVVDTAGVNEIQSDEGRYRARLLTPIATRGVQIQRIELDPECDSVGRPHPRGSQEFFLVLSGTATLTIADDEVRLHAQQLIQFPGHFPHRYANQSWSTLVRAISVVVLSMK
ncbi:MAG: helix-turn-helix domain-containing protein [bacterium]|nr:helix-turn-helix domain-containing protein [bacterium]MCP5065390.1 helix-turn-helix domain-containing protein [bacterium]